MPGRLPLRAIAVTTLILVAVLLPGSAMPDSPGIPGLDKLVHFVLFLALAVAVSADFDLGGRRRLVLAFVAAVAFSALTEALQLMVDGRSSEIVDMVADIAGFTVGLAARKSLSRLPGCGPRRGGRPRGRSA